MSATRLGSDACKKDQDAAASRSEYDYTFFTPKYSFHESCKKKNETCHLPDSVRADIESELKQLDKKATKCGGGHAMPVGGACLADGTCSRKTGFTPARFYDRDVAWTNLKKPSGTGL